MANLESILNELDEVLEGATTLPLTSKCMVDADRIRDLIDDIRLNIPSEIKQARAVVADRNEILSMAKQEAEELIRKAEERAKALVDNDTIVRQANAKGMALLGEATQKATDMVNQANARASEILSQASTKASEMLSQATLRSKEMKQTAFDFSESMLRSTEDVVSKSLEEIKRTHQAILTSARAAVQQNTPMPEANVRRRGSGQGGQIQGGEGRRRSAHQ